MSRSAGQGILKDMSPGFIRVCALASISSFTYGYDLNWWGAIIAQSWFNDYFGDRQMVKGGVTYHVLSSTQQSVGSATSPIGMILGCVVATMVSRPLGFRKALVISALWIITGTIVQITCGVGGARYWQLAGGKIIVTIGVGMNMINLPIYLANCSPPRLRGTAINSYAAVVALAAIVASSVIYALSTHKGHLVYLVPLAIQLSTPFLAIVTIVFLPENPQWLVQQGRTEEALKVLRPLRPAQGSDDLVRIELAEMIAATSEMGAKRGTLGDCFRGVQLRRTLACMGIACLFQAQGLNFLLGYLAVLFVQLGLPNPFQTLVIIYSIITACTIASFAYQDKIGRRLALLSGSAICALCMLGFAVVVTVDSTPTGAIGKLCVALIVLWFAGFTSTWYPVWNTVKTEIPAVDLRDYTLSIAGVAGQIVNAIIIFVSPYLQRPEHAGLGGKIGYIYGSFSIVSFVFVFFLVPELKGRPLPEIDWLFNHHVPVRAMKGYEVPSGTESQGGLSDDNWKEEK